MWAGKQQRYTHTLSVNELELNWMRRHRNRHRFCFISAHILYNIVICVACKELHSKLSFSLRPSLTLCRPLRQSLSLPPHVSHKPLTQQAVQTNKKTRLYYNIIKYKSTQLILQSCIHLARIQRIEFTVLVAVVDDDLFDLLCFFLFILNEIMHSPIIVVVTLPVTQKPKPHIIRCALQCANKDCILS